jgi:hypothetical protein
MPAGMTGGRYVRSKIRWFTERSAIHITYRISLRSSSMPEPRDPSLQVVMISHFFRRQWVLHGSFWFGPPAGTRAGQSRAGRGQRPPLGPPTEAVCSGPCGPPRVVRGLVEEVRRPCDPLMIPPLVHQRRPCYDFYFL